MIQARNAALKLRPVPEPSALPSGRIHSEKGYRRSKSILFLLLGCFLFGLVIIAQYSSMVTLNYRLSRAETRLKVLDEEYCRLEQEAARLGSLSRIESIARLELGMCQPESGQLIILTAAVPERGRGLPGGE